MTDKERQRRADEAARARAVAPETLSFTITEWCARRRVGRTKLYELWAQGRGPRTHRIGTKRLISYAADAEWASKVDAQAA